VRKAYVKHGVDGHADAVEAMADGLPVQVAEGNAPGARGELERREPPVETEVGQVTVTGSRVPLHDLVLGQQAGRGRGVSSDRARGARSLAGRRPA
jgi:hypothetical protein